MANELMRKWMLMNNRMRKMKSAFSLGCDFHMTELSALSKINRATQSMAGGIGNTEIQEELQITKSAVSQMLDSLSNKGYIERALDPNDRRRMCVSITPRGKQMLTVMSQHANLLAETVAAKMGDEKITQMFALIDEFMDVFFDAHKEMAGAKQAEAQETECASGPG